MPLLGTAGAASAKGFGLFRTMGGGSYAYVALGTNYTNTVYGGAAVTGMSLLASQPSSINQNAVGIVADGSFIALSGGWYSTNNGASWLQWSTNLGASTWSGMPPGLNGSVAYNPTSKRFFTFRTDYNYKWNSYDVTAVSVTSTGSTTSASAVSGGGSNFTGGVTYSPALNRFYVSKMGSSQTTTIVCDGTTGSRINVVGTSPNGNYQASISSDGYPLLAAYQGYGSVYNLRKYTASDLSSYTDFGTISDSYTSSPIQSPWVWLPVNNKYIIASGTGTSPSINVRSSSSSSPQSLGYIGSVTVSNYGVTSINFMEQSNGTIWMFGKATNYSKGYVPIVYTRYSTDGGVTWNTPSGTYLAIAKNFT